MAKKVNVYSLEGKPIKALILPKVFGTPIRPDVIKRVVIALQSHRLQPKGRDIMAGKKTTAESRGVGLGIARIPRVKGEGYPKAGRGALAPGTVGGREAHPPRVEKKIWKRINKKERRLAIRSAIAATARKDLVAQRGHRIDFVVELPLVVSDDMQKLRKAKEVRPVLMKLGVWPDVVRVKEGIRERAGKGKKRGRRLKVGKGPLFVIDRDEGIASAALNYPGIDVIPVNNLNAELLAPGTHAGRLTVWTESAFNKLDKIFGE